MLFWEVCACLPERGRKPGRLLLVISVDTSNSCHGGLETSKWPMGEVLTLAFGALVFIPLSPSVSLLPSLSAKEPEQELQWKLCFKLYCLLDADSIAEDSIEYFFLFEQVTLPHTPH